MSPRREETCGNIQSGAAVAACQLASAERFHHDSSATCSGKAKVRVGGALAWSTRKPPQMERLSISQPVRHKICKFWNAFAWDHDRVTMPRCYSAELYTSSPGAVTTAEFDVAAHRRPALRCTAMQMATMQPCTSSAEQCRGLQAVGCA